MRPAHAAVVRNTSGDVAVSDPRRAFTLVELLVVIAVLSILIALLLPAINGARRRTEVARVRIEISSIESAIAGFKARYGVEPPSAMILCEQPDDPNPAVVTDWDRHPAQRGLIRRLWPNFDFFKARDINRDGDTTDVIQLDASESWVFFLCGTIDDGTTHNGFSVNPADPFIRGGNRTPGLELDFSRFKDSDGDGFREYVDSFGTNSPYLYYSAHEGQGYDRTELLLGMTSVYLIPGTAKPHKPLSYQLLSAGMDGQFGNGGEFDADKPESLATGRPTTGPNAGGVLERDNVTNFASGELGR